MGAWEHRGLETGGDWRLCVLASSWVGLEVGLIQDVAADCKAPLMRA